MNDVQAELPKGWATSFVGDVAVQVTKGTTPTTMGFPYLPAGIRFVKVEAIENHRIVHDRCMFIGLDAHEALSRSQLAAGDVLISIAGTLGRIAIVAQHDVPANTNQALAIVRSDGAVLPAYLAHALSSSIARKAVSEGGRGIGLQNLNLGQVAKLPFLVAPLPEQHRIVEAIESYFTRLDDAVATLERVQCNLKRYRASVLKAAVEGRLVPTEAELALAEDRDYEPASVLLERILAERRRRWQEAGGRGKYQEPIAPDTSDLAELPEGWCWASLEALTSAVRVICYGILMPKKHIPHGVPYVKVRDMRSGVIAVHQLQRTLPEIDAKYARSRLKAGDLLLAIRGTWGRVVEVPSELEGGNITQDSARLALHPALHRRYIKYPILSETVQGFFTRVARGVAVKGVNIGDVRAAPIPLPPRAEQARVADYVEDLVSIQDAVKGIVAQNETRCGRLRQSILKWAFEGRLADQDPNEEPASTLLERIKAEREPAGSTDKKSRRTRKTA